MNNALFNLTYEASDILNLNLSNLTCYRLAYRPKVARTIISKPILSQT